MRDADLTELDLVVDLGAGTGRLTSELARSARRVLAVELDPHLADGLRGHWTNVVRRGSGVEPRQLDAHEWARMLAGRAS